MSSSENEVSEEECKTKQATKRTPVICDYCGRTLASKYSLYKHFRNCKHNSNKLNKCMWCGLEFYNRGVLANHALRLHGDNSYQNVLNKDVQLYRCEPCSLSFHNKITLKFHIRKVHFNLQGAVPIAEFKKVNQVWFEKARNSTRIVEMKKLGPSKLIIRTLSDNTTIKINDVKPTIEDLSDIYPTSRGKIECKLCNKYISRKDFKKHYNEKHLNLKNYHCNNCNRLFKRTYLFLKHVCSKVRKLKGVTNLGKQSDILITSVESLGMSLGS